MGLNSYLPLIDQEYFDTAPMLNTRSLGLGDFGNFDYATVDAGVPSFLNGGLIPQNLGGDLAPATFMDKVKAFGQWGAVPENQALLSAGGNALLGLGNLIGGFQQSNQAKKLMSMQMEQWGKNYDRQGKMINEALYDRQYARNQANKNEMSADDYVKKFGV